MCRKETCISTIITSEVSNERDDVDNDIKKCQMAGSQRGLECEKYVLSFQRYRAWDVHNDIKIYYKWLLRKSA